MNPIYFECLELYYDYNTVEEAPPIILNLWDHDESVFDGDDFLGRAVVYLQDAALCNDDSIPEPKWHDIKMSFRPEDPPCG